MPFLAYQERPSGTARELVTPEEVENGEDVFCPECEERMCPRGGAGQKARHFFHIKGVGGSSGCSGIGAEIGESEQHRVMKSWAVSGLRRRFEDIEDIKTCSTEVGVDVSGTAGGVSTRRADALVEFQGENAFFGEGVIVEVQYGNEEKNIPLVTRDYLSAGFGVFWASEDDFEEECFLLERFDEAFESRAETAFAPYFADPETVWSVFDAPDWFGLPEGWQFSDPNPDCKHEFERVGGDTQCLSAVLGISGIRRVSFRYMLKLKIGEREAIVLS